jgi:hypothetical protein
MSNGAQSLLIWIFQNKVLTYVRLLHKLNKQFIPFSRSGMFKSIFTALQVAWVKLTCHHQLHGVEHVGQFAGPLLPKEDWDHP